MENTYNTAPFNLTLPFSSVLYAAGAFLAGWLVLYLAGAVRYMQCPAWTPLGSPPEPAAQVLGSFSGKLYVQSAGGSVYVAQSDGWATARIDPDLLADRRSPAWVLSVYQPLPAGQTAASLYRANFLAATMYYFIQAGDGGWWACTNSINAELAGLFGFPWGLAWLLPAGVLAACLLAFFNDVARNGQVWQKRGMWSGESTPLK